MQGAPAAAREILSYFLRHPQAADDIEGVARWRLLDERVRSTVEEVQPALTWLVERGFLLAERTCAGGLVFHLNPPKASAAVALIRHRRPRHPTVRTTPPRRRRERRTTKA
jgi:hypothetical protein